MTKAKWTCDRSIRSRPIYTLWRDDADIGHVTRLASGSMWYAGCYARDSADSNCVPRSQRFCMTLVQAKAAVLKAAA